MTLSPMTINANPPFFITRYISLKHNLPLVLEMRNNPLGINWRME